MKRYILAGLVLFVVFAVVFAPAGILVRAVNSSGFAQLSNARGTLWEGNGTLLINGQQVGQSTWQFRPWSLLRLKPTFDWALNDPAVRLTGDSAASLGSVIVNLQGEVDAAAINPWIAPYEINIEGRVDLSPTRLQLSLADGVARIDDLQGEWRWSGGLTRYVLSGRSNTVALPPMTAFLEATDQALPAANVYADGSDIPLMVAGPGVPGFLKIGITKKFTQLLGSPWPGSDPDHKIVIEVEQQLL